MSVRLHGTFGNWLLAEGETVLGRGSDCGLRIDDSRLSRHHAAFDLRSHRLQVADLGSTNGVLVDGVRISAPCELHHGEMVACGPVVLRVSIDQTAPHPRRTEGAQDPATRRNAPRSDTEAMQPITAADRPSATATPSASREIDPAIAAAISGSGFHDPTRQSALHPVEQPGSITSPLDAVRPDPADKPSRRAPTTTTSSLEPPQLDPAATGALEVPRESPTARARLLAGCADGLLFVLALLPTIPVLLLGIGIALHVAGAVLVDGVPRLGPGHAAAISDLAASLTSREGLGRAGELVPAIASDPVVRAILAGSAGLAALVAALALMLALVHPTVMHGAPPAHRRLGIRLVCGNSRPGWARAMLRWLLAILLWPLAVPAALLGRRAPHDLLTGCTLVRAW